ncbi:hypothetical protein L9W73_18220 [Vibrio aestuarianus]|uniref:Uncharacterized protein n=1 Tax=Vibrio aestuarianus TaxID=28171 RepID=A0A9X4FI83_9VIBR|nr:hypothetical protein [Vibrio aestuarianus]MDE1359205.1 hypothetical protein [Vibrio aestuarianus]
MKIFAKECPLCSLCTQAVEIDHGNRLDLSCPTCGRYVVTKSVISNLTHVRREYLKVLLKTAEQKSGYYDISQNAEKELCHMWTHKT